MRILQVGNLVVETEVSETPDNHGLLEVFIRRVDGRPLTAAERTEVDRIGGMIDTLMLKYNATPDGSGWS